MNDYQLQMPQTVNHIMCIENDKEIVINFHTCFVVVNNIDKIAYYCNKIALVLNKPCTPGSQHPASNCQCSIAFCGAPIAIEPCKWRV